MAKSGIDQLIKEARKDPEFFHALVFDTEKALSSVDFLSREERAAILASEPDALISALATGALSSAALEAGCGGTCGASCGGSCGASCGGSCTVTCVASCPVSFSIEPNARSEADGHEYNINEITELVNKEFGGRRYTRFKR